MNLLGIQDASSSKVDQFATFVTGKQPVTSTQTGMIRTGVASETYFEAKGTFYKVEMPVSNKAGVYVVTGLNWFDSAEEEKAASESLLATQQANIMQEAQIAPDDFAVANPSLPVGAVAAFQPGFMSSLVTSAKSLFGKLTGSSAKDLEAANKAKLQKAAERSFCAAAKGLGAQTSSTRHLPGIPEEGPP